MPRFACGGGGSLLSAEAVRRMDLASCTADLHAHCMQSDWMIGGCAVRHNVSLVRELGCTTCDPKRLDHKAVHRRLSRDQCFFMQNAQEFAHVMHYGTHSPAIVHGLHASARLAEESEAAALDARRAFFFVFIFELDLGVNGWRALVPRSCRVPCPRVHFIL